MPARPSGRHLSAIILLAVGALAGCAPSLGLPLPRDLVVEAPPGQPSAHVVPGSARSLRLGQATPFDLGHCGLASPIDIDGSLWRPVGGTDARGGAIDGDAEVGELINATSGTFELVEADVARFVTPGGSTIWMTRRAGAAEYPFCD